MKSNEPTDAEIEAVFERGDQKGSAVSSADRRAYGKLRALFERARGTPISPQRARAVMSAVAQAQAGPPGESRRGHRRRWLALAGAAVAVSVAVVVSVWPQPSQAYSWEMTLNALDGVRFIKMIGEDGRAAYYDRSRSVMWATPDGRIGRWDLVSHEYTNYEPRKGAVIISQAAAPTGARGFIPVSSLEELRAQAAEWGDRFPERWTERTARIEGHDCIVLEARSPDQYIRKIEINARSGLILSRSTLEGTQRFEYPSSVPRDIYALGAPRDVKVLDWRASPEILHLREAVNRVRNESYGAYRAFVLESGDDVTVRRVICDGTRLRVDAEKLPERADPKRLAALAAEYAAGRKMTPYHSAIADEKFAYSISIDPDGEVLHRKRLPAAVDMINHRRLETLTYRGDLFSAWHDTKMEYLPPDEQGRVGCRWLGQANEASRPYMREVRFDPARGHAEASGGSYNFPNAIWQLDRNWKEVYRWPQSVVMPHPDDPPRGWKGEVLEWARLPNGRWYPSLQVSRQLRRSSDGSWEQDPNNPPSYRYILAEPLDTVPDHWFVVPEDWLESDQAR